MGFNLFLESLVIFEKSGVTLYYRRYFKNFFFCLKRGQKKLIKHRPKKPTEDIQKPTNWLF